MRRLNVKRWGMALAAAAFVGVGVWLLAGRDGATGDIKRAPAAAGARPSGPLWPGDLPNAPPELKSNAVRRQLDSVRKAWEAEDWGEVAKQSEAVLEGSPPHGAEAVAAYSLGCARMRQHDFRGAVAAFGRCVRASEASGGAPGGFLGQASHLLLFSEVAAKLKGEAQAAAEARRLIEEMPDAEGALGSLQLVSRHLRATGGSRAPAAYLEDLVARYPLKAAGCCAAACVECL